MSRLGRAALVLVDGTLAAGLALAVVACDVGLAVVRELRAVEGANR